MDSWIQTELASLQLGDLRLQERAERMIRRMADKPNARIPGAFTDRAEAKAAYRFLANPAVHPEALLRALADACVQRIQGEPMILAIQDTTSFDFSQHHNTAGLGPLGGCDGTAGLGFFCHSTLAASTGGVPLGLLCQKRWSRDPDAVGSRHQRHQRPIQDKESFRWLEALRAVHELVPAEITVVTVADREADIFEMLAEPRPENSRLLIRACRNRRVSEEQQWLMEAVAAAPLAGEYDILVRQHPNHEARVAHLCLRFRKVTIHPPTGGVHEADLEPVELTAVNVEEASPPEGKKAVHWLLLTDLPVESFEDARECVRLYSLRWLIERYHFVLKSGCGMEGSQLRTFEGLERLLALYCVVALRLLWVMYASREEGEQPCTVAFTEVEARVLYEVHHGTGKAPEQPLSLRQAVWLTARLGGFLGRKGDGEPGIKVLWRGLMRLQDMVLGYLLSHPQDVGNA